MTDQELLQQAKDQIAKDNGYNYPDGKNWYRFTFRMPSKRLEEACDEAAKRAIQKAREEAQKDAYLTGYYDGKEGNPCLYKN